MTGRPECGEDEIEAKIEDASFLVSFFVMKQQSLFLLIIKNN